MIQKEVDNDVTNIKSIYCPLNLNILKK